MTPTCLSKSQDDSMLVCQSHCPTTIVYVEEEHRISRVKGACVRRASRFKGRACDGVSLVKDGHVTHGLACTLFMLAHNDSPTM